VYRAVVPVAHQQVVAPRQDGWRCSTRASFAGCLAAEELGIPHVAVNGYASGHLVSQQDPVREPLNRWREARGLPPDPELRMLYRFLELIPFPPSLRHPDAPCYVRRGAFNHLSSATLVKIRYQSGSMIFRPDRWSMPRSERLPTDRICCGR
jgi:hypothetical protein